ncbi:uncharacterized protein LOC143349289 [Colletes latitarsis]|uniref:uncharacterized protein LOC143349289 n=1 Tax=Colletes latitarsis TaxID=2605962 RepID=UPI0040358F1B
MSFSKGKIQRFNEFKNEVPPPGAYDPKFDEKVKGSVIEKSERFLDNKILSGAECSSILSKSTSSLHVNFKSPQCPPRKLISRSCTKVKPHTLISINDKKVKYKSENHVAGLKAECVNKGKTIQKHEKQIQDMREEVEKLESKLEELRKKQVEVENQHKTDIETLTKLQQEVLKNNIEKHQIEIEHLHGQLSEITRKKESEIQIISAVDGDLRNQIAMLEIDLANKEHASQEKIQTLEAQVEELVLKLEKLTTSYKCEISSLEHEKLELNSCITNLTDKIDECEEKLKRVITESDAKILAMIREAKVAVEEEMRLTAERYEAYLAQVEMERVALDNRLVQKDVEITRLFDIFEELKSSAETQENFGQSLQIELDRTEAQLARKKEELRVLKDQIHSEAAEIVSKKKRFEVIMAENQASVAALTQHLMQNDTEAEKLQQELKCNENRINGHRDLLSIMRNNSQMVHVQIHALMEQLNEKKGSVSELETEHFYEVESIKSIFETKIDGLRQAITKQVTLQVQAQLEADIDEKDAQNVKLQNQLHEMSKQLNDARDMLRRLEEKYDARELEVSRVHLVNNKLNGQLKTSKAALEETKKLLELQSAEHKIDLDEANAKIQELSDQIKNFEEKKDFVEVKLFDEERARRIAAEEEIQTLLECNGRLAKDYQEISQKYTEFIGHQNHRQRIKHVSQLKDKILQLEQDLLCKTRTIGKQQKIIVQLKADGKCGYIKEKENTLILPKFAHSTPETSPHKPFTPLQNRND